MDAKNDNHAPPRHSIEIGLNHEARIGPAPIG